MTPESIRTLSQLRQTFYSRFAAEMDVPVKITNRNSQINNVSIASWVDSRQRLNYLSIFAHTAPDDLVPDRPLILRIAVNTGGDFTAVTRQRKSGQEMNRNWHFELTLLPSEILDFLPWMVSLVRCYDTEFASSVAEPPHPLECNPSTTMRFHNTKTHRAGRQLSRQWAVSEKQPALF